MERERERKRERERERERERGPENPQSAQQKPESERIIQI